jgi:hypothetical protein
MRATFSGAIDDARPLHRIRSSPARGCMQSGRTSPRSLAERRSGIGAGIRLAFTNDADLVYVETKTWYGIPHSVTTTLVTSDGTLYVPSLYQDGGEFPNERYWNKNIARDPDVRVGIDGKIYERRAALVTDAAERARVLDAFAAKYARWKEMLKNGEPEKPRIILLRMDARTPA